MTTRIRLAAAAAVVMMVPAAARAEDAIGLWRTPTRNGEVEIVRCGAALCGRLVSSDGLRADPGG